MNEEWKAIEGYEGLYEISNLGNVRSLNYRNKKGCIKIMNPKNTTTGYYNICLMKDKKKTYPKIHRLVAQAFIPNPDNKPIVNHIDGDKHNNAVSNLEWCTHKENTAHAINSGLFETNLTVADEIRQMAVDKNKKPVLCITTGEIYHSAKEASIATNIKHSTLTACCRGQLKSAGKLSDGTKLLWKYI